MGRETRVALGLSSAHADFPRRRDLQQFAVGVGYAAAADTAFLARALLRAAFLGPVALFGAGELFD